MTVAPDAFQLRVAKVALAVADQHGFALGGGHALLAHGLVHRPTEDVDLFTDREDGVGRAAELVRSALVGAGFEVSTPADDHELDGVAYGMGEAFAEFEVSEGSMTVLMSLAQLARRREPVVMAVGSVLDLDDLLGSKACALATRFEVRDYIDVAAAIDRGYSRTQLIAMANEHDPAAVSALREEFAAWPR